MKKTSVILSVVATILSLLALYIAISNPTKDNSANLIATLGVLGTVLIGWQIFSFINLFQYEKRMKSLEEDIEKSKDDLNEAIKGTYTSMTRSEGLMFRGFADVYHYHWDTPFMLPETYLHKHIMWLLLEIDSCLYTLEMDELKRAKEEIKEVIKSKVSLPDSFKDGIKRMWKNRSESFIKSSSPKPKMIIDEIEDISQLLDSI